MGNILKSIGGFLLAAGLASIALFFFDMNLKILMWIDMWGETIGWIIRIGTSVVGGIMLVIGLLNSKK